MEKKRLREEEKRKRREEERRKRKEAEKHKKISEKEIRIKLLKKPEKGDEPASEKHKEKDEEADTEENKWDKSPGPGSIRSKSLEGSLKELKEKIAQPCSCTSQGLASEHIRDPRVKPTTAVGSLLKMLLTRSMRWITQWEVALRRVRKQNKTNRRKDLRKGMNFRFNITT